MPSLYSMHIQRYSEGLGFFLHGDSSSQPLQKKKKKTNKDRGGSQDALCRYMSPLLAFPFLRMYAMGCLQTKDSRKEQGVTADPQVCF